MDTPQNSDPARTDRPSPDPAPEGTPPLSGLRWVVGLLIVASVFIAAVQLNPLSFWILWNVPTVFLVGNLVFALLIMNYPVGEIFGGFWLPFSQPGSASTARLAALESCMLSGSRYALSSGAVVYVIGLIALLRCLSDVASIGPNMAVCLLSLLYGLLLSEAVFHPLALCARRRLDAMSVPAGAPSPSDERGHALLVFLYVLMGLVVYGLLLLSIAPFPH